MTYVLIFIALIFLPRIIGRFRVWLSVFETRFVLPRISALADSEVDPERIPIFEFARTQLESGFGFKHRGTIETVRELPESLAIVSDVFVSQDGRTLAFATQNLRPQPVSFNVVLTSILNDGQRLETVNSIQHYVLDSVSDMDDVWTSDLGYQIRHHEIRLETETEDRTSEPIDFSRSELHEIIQYQMTDSEIHFESLKESGLLVTTADGHLRYTAAAAFRLSKQIMEGEKYINSQHEKQITSRQTDPLPFSVEADLAEFKWFEQVRNALSSRRTLLTKWILLVISAVGFLLVFGLWMGLTTSALLLAIVFVHELGHISAMALFGYRNRQVLFIPFFGAAAFGEKVEAPAWQQLIVLFMGPIPGVVVGLVCFGYILMTGIDKPNGFERDSLFVITAAMTLILNYINLLPIGFLDGGKIVQILFLSRLPRAQFVFQLLSTAAFFFFAFTQRSVILGIIGFFSLVALPAQWRLGTMIKQIRTSFNKTFGDLETSKEQKRLEVFRMLREPQYQNVTPVQRQQLAKQLIDYIETSQAGLPTIIIGASIYILSIFLPILLMMIWFARS